MPSSRAYFLEPKVTKVEKNKEKECVTQKRPYLPPRLEHFGTIKALTQSGSLNASENSRGCGTGFMAHASCASDRVAKENIVRIGEHPLGIGLYLFDYKPAYREQWGHDRQFGVMADEVEMVMPKAVTIHADGYKMVNYQMLGIDRPNH